MPLLPTQVIGSYGTPGWLYVVRDSMKAGDKMGPVDINEAFDDATNLAIMEMEEAGVDVISDGEMRRFNFLVGFYDYIQGGSGLCSKRRARTCTVAGSSLPGTGAAAGRTSNATRSCV